jgi:hypothetical protein
MSPRVRAWRGPRINSAISGAYRVDLHPVYHCAHAGYLLKDVITTLKLRKCEYIQDFHTGEFERPKADEPIIESIKVQ